MTSKRSDFLRPENSESLLGYFRRLGRAKAHYFTSDFLTELGNRYGRRLVDDIAAIEEELGVPPGTLERLAPSSPPKDSSRDWQYERLHSDPVCPQCLAEKKPYQAHWRHSLVTACHEHRLRLVDVCPNCTERLTPKVGGYRLCSCGFALDKLPQYQASEHECDIASAISGTGSLVPHAKTGTTPPSNIGKFIHFLASGFQASRTGKSGKTKIPKTVEDAVRLMAPVELLLANWPHGFEDYVKELLNEGDPAATSAPERLGNWYQRLMRFREPEYDVFKDAVARVIEKEFSGFHPGHLASTSSREWLPATEAARQLGISAQRLVAAVQKKEIAGKISQRGFGHNQTVVPRFEVLNIAADRRRFWSAAETCDYLGVGRTQFQFLKELGVVGEVPVSDRPPLVDGRFYSNSVEDLVLKIRASATEVTGEAVLFRELTLNRTTDKTALKKLIRLICEGSVAAALEDQDVRFGDFRFQKSAVEELLRSERHSLDWTANDVAKLTGWKAQAVTHWCKLGLLGSRTVPHGPSESFLVKPQQLAIFQSEYMPVATLARSRGTTSRKLLSDFESKGIETHGAQIEGKTTRGHLVKLSDLASLLSEAA